MKVWATPSLIIEQMPFFILLFMPQYYTSVIPRARMCSKVSYIYILYINSNTRNTHFYGSIVAATELSQKNGATTAQQCWQHSWRSQMQHKKLTGNKPFQAPPPAAPHMEANHTYFDLRTITVRGVWDLWPLVHYCILSMRITHDGVIVSDHYPNLGFIEEGGTGIPPQRLSYFVWYTNASIDNSLTLDRLTQ